MWCFGAGVTMLLRGGAARVVLSSMRVAPLFKPRPKLAYTSKFRQMPGRSGPGPHCGQRFVSGLCLFGD